MTIRYKQLPNGIGGTPNTNIRRIEEDGTTGDFPPDNLENRHAVEYQAWLAAGGIPEPADE